MNILSRYLKNPDLDLRKTNYKLLYIAIANLLDGVLTYIGVASHNIIELNGLMTGVVANLYLLIVVKIAIPTLLLLLITYSINKYGYGKMKVAVLFINICFSVYVLIILIHFIWVMQVF